LILPLVVCAVLYVAVYPLITVFRLAGALCVLVFHFFSFLSHGILPIEAIIVFAED
jgi:hypothetical protein